MAIELASFQFPKLREHFDAIGVTSDLPDWFTKKYNELYLKGATFTARRMAQMDGFAAILPAEALIRLVDTEAALTELEEVSRANQQAQRALRWRNILALVPLFLTWIALWSATVAYQAEIAGNPRMIVQPFLVLWERRFDGFLGVPWLTFSWTAGLDFLLILGLMYLTWRAQTLEQRARRESRDSIISLENMLTDLGTTLAMPGNSLGPGNNPEKWAAEVRRVIEHAMKMVRKLADENQRTVQTAREQVEQLAQLIREVIGDFAVQTREAFAGMREENQQFLKKTAGDGRDMLLAAHKQAQELVEHFEVALERMQVELARNQSSTDTLVTAMSDIRQAANGLSGSATSFADTAKFIDIHMVTLEHAQTSFVQQTASAAQDMKDAAQSARGLLSQISGTLKTDIQQIGSNVSVASDQLAKIETSLAAAAQGLTGAIHTLRTMPRPDVYVDVSLFPKQVRTR